MKRLMVLALLVLAGCEDPSLGLTTTFDSNGARVSPVVSGRVGDVGVAVSP